MSSELFLQHSVTPRIAALLSRPTRAAVVCIVALSAAGWLALGLMLGLSGEATGVFAVLCRPLPAAQAPGIASALLVALMWMAMTLAMMLPTAGPMILTYADIAETAWRKRESIVSPLVLVGGYLAVWLGFALAAAAVQLALMSGAAAAVPARWSLPLAALLMIVAGLYQFSALKQSCLSACQHPFPFFFANWTDRAGGVFRLGLRQGLHCLGCCWALMALMLAAGAMNIVWMAVLAIVMVTEKMSATARFSRAVGAILIAAGLGTAVAALWN